MVLSLKQMSWILLPPRMIDVHDYHLSSTWFCLMADLSRLINTNGNMRKTFMISPHRRSLRRTKIRSLNCSFTYTTLDLWAILHERFTLPKIWMHQLKNCYIPIQKLCKLYFYIIIMWLQNHPQKWFVCLVFLTRWPAMIRDTESLIIHCYSLKL